MAPQTIQNYSAEPESGSEFDYDLSTSAENKNTKRKTETDMRIFSSFLLTLNEPRAAETIEPGELNRYLTTFFSVIKKHDGNEYEPASLRGMLCSIERYLRSRSYPKSLTRDPVFLSTRNTLKDRQLVLREMAKSAKKGKQEILTSSSIEKLKQLYSAKEFGPYSPMAVINSLCFAFVVHLKIRKAIDHKQLLWGDIALKTQDAREYLCYDPMQGRDYFRQRLGNISHYRIYSHSDPGSPTDPVAVYKLYASKRPSQVMSPDSPFYLGLAVNQTLDQQPQWFKPSPMGVNKLNDLVRMIREITGNLTVTVPNSVDNDVDRGRIDAALAANAKGSESSFNAPWVPSVDDSNAEGTPTKFCEDIGVAASTDCAHESDKDGKENRANLIDGENETCLDTEAKASHLENENGRNSSNSTLQILDGTTDRKSMSLGQLSEIAPTNSSPGQTGEQKLAKQAIAHILNSLEPSEKQAVVRWVTEAYKCEDVACKKCATPRQFSINFTMNGTGAASDIVVKASLVQEEPHQPDQDSWPNTAPVSRTSSPASRDRQAFPVGNSVELHVPRDDSNSETENENVDCAQSGVDQVAEDSHGSTSPQQERARAFTMQVPASHPDDTICRIGNGNQASAYKRLASDDSDRGEPKMQKICDQEDETVDSITDDVEIDIETDSGHTNIISKETSPLASIAASSSNNDVRTDPRNVKPWFAAWPFDPRLVDPRVTMYLRQGLVPMYGDYAGYMGNVNPGDS